MNNETIKYHLAFYKGFTVLEVVRGDHSIKIMRNLSQEASNSLPAQFFIDNCEVDL